MQVELRNYQELDYFRNEAFKALRTNITFCGKDVRVIAITSSISNEGKSDVTFNLAHAFAQDGNKVLYIDADNRNSVQTGRQGVTEEVMGLSHYLTGKTESLSDTITETNIENLYYIFTGPKAPNPTELLGSTRFKNMLSELREQFDYIFIDSPPLGAVIDAAIIAKECDGAIIVIEEGTISRSLAIYVKDQLHMSGVRILGTVLNKVESQGKGYGYGYGYGYGEEDDDGRK